MQLAVGSVAADPGLNDLLPYLAQFVAAEVAKNHVQPRHGARQFGHPGDLVKENRGVERKPEAPEAGEPFADGAIRKHVLEGTVRTPWAHRGVLVPVRRIADSAKATGARRDVCLEHRGDARSELHVGPAHHARRHGARPVQAACRHRGHALHEFGLTYTLQFLGICLAVHRVAVCEHSRDDIVAAEFAHELVDEVALIGRLAGAQVPEVVVRVAERKLRL